MFYLNSLNFPFRANLPLCVKSPMSVVEYFITNTFYNNFLQIVNYKLYLERRFAEKNLSDKYIERDNNLCIE